MVLVDWCVTAFQCFLDLQLLICGPDVMMMSADWACVCSLSPQAWWDGDGERGGEGELWGHQESSDGSAGEPDHTFQVWTSHRFTTKIWWKPVGFYFSTMWEFKHIYLYISFGFASPVSDVWVELIFRIISLQRHWACLCATVSSSSCFDQVTCKRIKTSDPVVSLFSEASSSSPVAQ